METVRKWVQVMVALLTNGNWTFPFNRTIYQGPLKVVCSPGLNCYSCPASTTYCPLGAIQNLMGGMRMAVENGQNFFGLFVVGTIGVVGAFGGRLVCGWACPFGLIQELLYRLPSRKFSVPRPFRYVKYFLLVVAVVLLPLLVVGESGLGSPWFCKYICPAGTLEAGLPMLFLQPDLRQTVGMLFYNKLVLMVLFVGWSIVASRPFCRTTCPLGAFYALFRRTKLVKLRLDARNCTRCGACHHVCPMGVNFNETPEDGECISCMKCMVQACKYDAIYLEIGGMPVSSLPEKRVVPVENSGG